jgi:3-oxoacyl-[acyl-carrier protein] reductase
MDLGISGRAAVVTGASAGIGLAVARELVDNGASVVVAARDPDRLAAAASLLRGRPGAQVATIAVDVAHPEAAERVVETAASAFGRLDILVNNAGRAHAGGLMAASEAEWDEMTAVKLTAARRLCRAAIPLMRENGWGRIVNMSSIGGTHPNPKLLVSHVLSAAIDNLTKSLAIEVAGEGILVNAIGVGAVATENWANNMIPALRRARPELGGLDDDAVLARVSRELTPVGRAGRPEEIAALAAFLASDRNGFVTGAVVHAAGGAERFL